MLLAISMSSGAGFSQASSPRASSTVWTSTIPSTTPSLQKNCLGYRKESTVVACRGNATCVPSAVLPTDRMGICECFKSKSTTTLKGLICAFHPPEAAIMKKDEGEKKR